MASLTDDYNTATIPAATTILLLLLLASALLANVTESPTDKAWTRPVKYTAPVIPECFRMGHV